MGWLGLIDVPVLFESKKVDASGQVPKSSTGFRKEEAAEPQLLALRPTTRTSGKIRAETGSRLKIPIKNIIPFKGPFIEPNIKNRT